MIVRKEGENVRLYSRNAIDWKARLPAPRTITMR
jgi:ATP-dependent DNA ligase